MAEVAVKSDVMCLSAESSLDVDMIYAAGVGRGCEREVGDGERALSVVDRRGAHVGGDNGREACVAPS